MLPCRSAQASITDDTDQAMSTRNLSSPPSQRPQPEVQAWAGSSLRACPCPDPLFSQGPRLTGSRPSPVTLCYLNHLCKGPITEYSHSLSGWGVKPSIYEFQRDAAQSITAAAVSCSPGL